MTRHFTGNLNTSSLADQIFASVKAMILAGKIRGGERIPEVRIAEDFGVSRTPIREALRKLETYGLVSIKPRCYAEVLKLGNEEVRALTEVRVALERLAVRLFAERADGGGLEAVRLLAADCASAAERGDVGEFYERDSLFHLEIARRSGNAYLYGSLSRLDAQVQLSRLVKPSSPDDIGQSVREHDLIVLALEARQFELAESSMEQHILNNL